MWFPASIYRTKQLPHPDTSIFTRLSALSMVSMGESSSSGFVLCSLRVSWTMVPNALPFFFAALRDLSRTELYHPLIYTAMKTPMPSQFNSSCRASGSMSGSNASIVRVRPKLSRALIARLPSLPCRGLPLPSNYRSPSSHLPANLISSSYSGHVCRLLYHSAAMHLTPLPTPVQRR